MYFVTPYPIACCVASNTIIPEITDPSLFTFERKTTTHPITGEVIVSDEYYIMKYDGIDIMQILCCVPLDDTLKSLFTEHLVIYRKSAE